MVPGFSETNARRGWPAILAFLLGCPGMLTPAFAAEKPELKAEVAGFANQAAQYSIDVVSGDRGPQPLELVREPILIWSNPLRNDARGAYFVWVLEGRPLVVGTIMTHPLVRDATQRVMRHEFHSLAPGEVHADFEGRTVWTPTTAGVRWNTLEVASPDADRQRRLLQMKGLARRVKARAIDGNERSTTLRLLPNPLFRYESSSNGVIDGALFAFVTGTDPEVLLLLEAHGSVNRLPWRAACARQTAYELQVEFPDGSSWSAAKLENHTVQTGSFISLRMRVFPAE